MKTETKLFNDLIDAVELLTDVVESLNCHYPEGNEKIRRIRFYLKRMDELLKNKS